MPDRLYRRLRRYAGFSAAQVLVAVVATLSGAPPDYALAALLVVSVPVCLAWGPYQAVIAMNPNFEDHDRRRWRIMLVCIPGSMAVYWHRHIRVS
ncbi:MAG: hypothetical protein ABW167_08870 [Baekduia sp.]